MSQIQRFGTGVAPGGTLNKLTGDNGLAVGPDGANNIFILGENSNASVGFASIEGDPVTFTLSVIPLSDTVSTVDATATYFLQAFFDIPINTAVVMSAHVIGNRDDFSAACGGFTTGCARRAGAGVIFVGDSTLASEDAPAGTPQFGIGVNGTKIQVYAQGLIGENWNWTCTFQYYVQLA